MARHRSRSSSQDSTSSRSSSSSSSSSSTTSSRSRSRGRPRERPSPVLARNNRETSPLLDADGVPIPLAAPAARIPHMFEDATEEIPPPPQAVEQKRRTRILVSDEAKARFEQNAKGRFLAHKDRKELIADLPLLPSIFALPPSVDEQIRSLLRERDDVKFTLFEGELTALHEILLASLNLNEVIRRLLDPSALSDSITGYLNVQGSLLGAGIREVLVSRRDGVLRNMGVKAPCSLAPSLRRAPLDGSHHTEQASAEKVPDLFGTSLREEMQSSDSSLKKAIRSGGGQRRGGNSKPPAKKARRHSRMENRSVPPSPPSSSRIAGRIADFLEGWRALTADPVILDTVRGYHLPFRCPPPLRVVSDFSRNPPSNLSGELSRMEQEGIIIPLPPCTPVFISSLFGVPKKDGSTRPIINLRPLNASLLVPHFKMESLNLVRDLVRAGDFLCKVDMSHAYFAINIVPSHRPFLAFIWKESLYAFSCLPFGLASAPLCYSKLMRVIAESLRSQGIRLVHYLDDWLFIGDSPPSLLEEVNRALVVFESCGLTINREKSILSPVSSLEFLGILVDAGSACFSLPLDKAARIKSQAAALLEDPSPSAREVASFIGRANFVAVVAPLSSFHLRPLQRLLGSGTSPDPASFDHTLSLDVDSRTDLRWWRDHVGALGPHSFIPFSPTVSIATDASLSGWGAACCGKRCGGRWSRVESSEHINYLELLAVFFGLKCFGDKWKDMDLLIESDNTCTVGYIRNRGGTVSRRLSALAEEIWLWGQARNIRLQATHLPGVLNVVADAESRDTSREASEWALSTQVVEALFSRFGRPSIDLFATRLNTKLPKYMSLFSDPFASAIDAFSHDWWGHFGYAFPPFALAGRVIQKAIADDCQRLLITPLWRSQAWFALALKYAREPPLLIPGTPDLLLDPRGDPHPLLEQRSFALLAWRISRPSGPPTGSRRQLKPSSWPAGLPVLSPNTTRPSAPGTPPDSPLRPSPLPPRSDGRPQQHTAAQGFRDRPGSSQKRSFPDKRNSKNKKK